MVRASSPRRIRRRIPLTEKAWEDAVEGGKVCSVAVVSSVALSSSHLSTNRMLFYFFQSKCVVIVCFSFRFPDPVEDLCMKQFWSVFPDGFLENFTEV